MKNTVLLLLAFLLLLVGFFAPRDLTGEAILRASSLQNRIGTGVNLEDLPPSPSPNLLRRAYLTKAWKSGSLDRQLVFPRTGFFPDSYKTQYGYAFSQSHNPYLGTSLGDLDDDGALTKDDVYLLSQLVQRLGGRTLDPSTFSYLCGGSSGIADKYCPRHVDYQRADLDGNGRADYNDLRILNGIVTNQNVKRQVLSTLFVKPSDCTEPGKETVNLYGQKGTCKEISVSGYYHYTDWEDPPSHMEWVQSPHGVRLRNKFFS